MRQANYRYYPVANAPKSNTGRGAAVSGSDAKDADADPDNDDMSSSQVTLCAGFVGLLYLYVYVMYAPHEENPGVQVPVLVVV